MDRSKQPQDDATELIERLATRVRAVRKARGLPRRVLSEMSRVSPRYLAQLEAGEGNISVGLLQRVARALDIQIETLLSENRPGDCETDRVANLYRDAPDDVKRQVETLLAPQDPMTLRASRICLVGLRGAGKSTLGRLTGEALGMPFVELNHEIEAHTDMPLPEVLALYGHDGYRRLEAEAIARVIATYDRLVLAVAGGLVADETTYEKVLTRFHTVWIETSPSEHMERVRAQGDLRPMRGNPAAMAQLKALLEARTPQYEKAQARLNTSNKTVATSLNNLARLIAANGFLDTEKK